MEKLVARVGVVESGNMPVDAEVEMEQRGAKARKCWGSPFSAGSSSSTASRRASSQPAFSVDSSPPSSAAGFAGGRSNRPEMAWVVGFGGTE
eukprot:1330451-Lingulodinium_polyedra.AAC.1